MTPEGQGTLPDQEDDQKAEQPSEAERKSNLINALDAIDEEAQSKVAGEAYGFGSTRAPADIFVCQCGSERFVTSFKLGRPAGVMYEQMHSCYACHLNYTAEEVAVALSKVVVL